MHISVLIATHKPYHMPSDPVYLPIFVGSSLHSEIPDGYQRDDQGINISDKNPHYNEVTAIYWASQNLNADAIGLVHYRRYFSNRSFAQKKDFSSILRESQIEDLLKRSSIIVPKPRNYYIETIESHYRHSHSAIGIDALYEIIAQQPAEYRESFSKVMHSKQAHMFNMFIMRREEFMAYSSWLFSVLFAVEAKIDFSKLQGNESRVMGFLAELLMDTWLLANNKTFLECPVIFMENEHIVKKARNLILNKLTGTHVNLDTHIGTK
ncbi:MULTISPECIES: DUF4422 domain-containing protein [Lacticaseibacillus]|uniref:DUF4422 domain-containing protein n=1 Tax=Lacticaseibacillus zeae subsp. silagei TaxID=3068307 RepID=A0ABD7Z732_LACZE|nr:MULTISPECIES: DUF4422 domain-containing protein [Lacticaseibacillus]OFR91543.1 exopolysaccharide biosynthesis protein [Lactobacillus sp. HMSC068F07]MDE3282999.1 DUF4422 domain-containing protein [Lacticaseibacillus casei]MDE3315714.1 DUF4422 domain-containing protein [Lacticaseibacillus zeae]WLV82769.1 DUF4422 domain-containing protein [Lacticaseibacillus sp. NCIMB 15475]WLV85510.1 DUF4422 domain-containing protein [Lacticaseibacillus sp. NCIMB 15474]